MNNAFRIYVFGEILWDLLPSGKQLGGAPANFAYHANVLGGCAKVKSRIGNDDLGREMKILLQNRNIPLDFIETDPILPTGTVVVHLTSNGQPSYEIVENVAWDNIQIDDIFLNEVKTADAFYFGSLAARSSNNIQMLQRILETVPKNALKVFDLNLRKPFYSKEIIDQLLKQSNVFKLNNEELFILMEMLSDRVSSQPATECSSFFSPSNVFSNEINEWIELFIRYYRLNHLILTCGSSGSFIWDSQGHYSFAPANEVAIVDTVGAGDSFTAVCVLGLLNSIPLDQINRNANRYAAFVCSQSGAMPDVSRENIIFD